MTYKYILKITVVCSLCFFLFVAASTDEKGSNYLSSVVCKRSIFFLSRGSACMILCFSLCKGEHCAARGETKGKKVVALLSYFFQNCREENDTYIKMETRILKWREYFARAGRPSSASAEVGRGIYDKRTWFSFPGRCMFLMPSLNGEHKVSFSFRAVLASSAGRYMDEEPAAVRVV